MRYIDEFRDRKLVERLSSSIHKAAPEGRVYNIMDVCGTHTMNIFRFGIREILPRNINLISGPGCPVCVTPNSFLDKAIELAKMEGNIIATFGDMFRVPGSFSSLEKERGCGRSIKIVYSTTDALRLAGDNPAKNVIFLGVGFETTIPTVAQSILIAKKRRINNYFVLCGHKTMPMALEALAKDVDISLDGLILPGHVSTIIGPKPYGFLSVRFGKRCVIAGFEPLDILQAVFMLITQKTPKVEIQYRRIINEAGNRLARKAIRQVFEETDSVWRGIGLIKKSGLKIRKEFSSFDAELRFRPIQTAAKENKDCICGDVLKGIKTPLMCGLFGRKCAPENPVGACMVSSEGTCAAYYKYGLKGS